MFRTFSLFCVLTLTVLLTACNMTESQPQAAFVDVALVFKESAPGKSAAIFLQAQQKYMEDELAKAQKVLEADPDNEEVRKYFATTRALLQKRLQAEQQNVANILNAQLQRVVKTYRNEKKLAFLLSTQSTLAFDIQKDVTEDILIAMNKESTKFATVTDQTPMPPVPGAASDIKGDDKE